MSDYENKSDYSDTIKVAKQRIEKYNAEQLYRTTQVTGIIFNLKNNFDWKDKREVEHDVSLDTTREKIGAFLDDTDEPEDSETSEQEDVN